MILKAELAFGPPNARRYVIINFKTGEAWDGSGFVADWNAATKYASANKACGDMQAILKQEYGNLPLRKYTVPIEIQVYGDVSPGGDFTIVHDGCKRPIHRPRIFLESCVKPQLIDDILEIRHRVAS